jgi:hypothetical protein
MPETNEYIPVLSPYDERHKIQHSLKSGYAFLGIETLGRFTDDIQEYFKVKL